MTAGFQTRDGRVCAGLNSMQLAFALRIGSEQIFAANQGGLLILEHVEEVAPSLGAVKAKRYHFRVGNNTANMTIELSDQSGTA